MPRQKNTKDTAIYWLLDVRPETIAVGWLQGLPFYCGTTVGTLVHRLAQHRISARRCPNRPISIRLRGCGEHVRIAVLEIVPPEGKWSERERHWIERSRRMFPESMINVSDGGDGPAGLIHSAEAKAKVSAANKGRKHTPEWKARISVLLTGRKKSPETCRRISTAKKGRAIKPLGPESLAKIAAAHRGMKRPPGTGAKIVATRRANAQAAQNA